MKKITLFLSRFIILSLLMPTVSFAPDAQTAQHIISPDVPSMSDTASIDAKTTSENPSFMPKNEPFATQGALSAADAALANTMVPEKSLSEQPAEFFSGQTTNALSGQPTEKLSEQTTSEQTTSEQTTIEFHYVNEDIINIVNALASKKGVNVIIPLGANTLSTKVTLSLPNRITLDDAWALLQTLLDLSGYSMIPRGTMYYITKKNGVAAKEPLPLFVGMKPSELPDTDERIRYIYYLSNIKVSDAPDSELAVLLKELLPQPDSAFKMDPPSNGLIISARSREIKSLMDIIIKLDKVGFLEKFEIFKLRFTNAKDVADLFNTFLLKTDSDPNRYRLDTKSSTDATYFSKFTRIIPDSRTNSLIILGKFQAIERIKEFIRLYIDVKIDTGKSPIHVYDLEYLKAEEIAPILEKIIQDDLGGGTGQSQAGGPLAGGTQRSFGEVRVVADTPTQAPPVAGQEGTGPSYYGGNKLIVACSNDDWREIEKLIQSLDQPRSQVLMEVLIANLTLDDVRQLGTSIRNPGKLPMPGDMNFQTTNLGNLAVTEGTSPNKTLQADLLKGDVTPPVPSPVTFAGDLNGTVVSLSDANGKVWGVADIVKNFDSQNLLAAPHIIATNNQKAAISRTEIRRLKDQSSSSGNTTNIAYKEQNAALSVEITPRISESDDVNMQIKISINDFRESSETTDNTPLLFTRELSANTTVKDGNILVLGGLVRLDDTDITTETPLLAKIPLIGWLFKNKKKQLVKTNLTIFIKPIIIKPRLRAGLQEHSQEFLNYVSDNVKESSIFGTFKDPITRMFFASETHGTDMIDDFMRFKQEEVAKSAGAPTQHIDLTDGESAESRKNARKKRNRSQAESTPENEEMLNTLSLQDISENEVLRAEMAKKLLKDAENPLTPQQKKNLQDKAQDKPAPKKAS